MKSTGIVRKIDNLGRIVLPKELRRTFGIGDKQPMEIFVDGKQIILKKYAPGCAFCESQETVVTFKGKTICEKCREELVAELEDDELVSN
jgi:transcriptional pleiotropic regulator of transition state genes